MFLYLYVYLIIEIFLFSYKKNSNKFLKMIKIIFRSCNNFKINGYSDWKVPSKDELNLLYQFSKLGLGNFSLFYWSSTTTQSEIGRIGQAFRSVSYGMQAGEQSDNRSLGYVGNGRHSGISVRAVRTF